MPTTADEGRTPPPRRSSAIPDHEHDRYDEHDRDHDRFDEDDRYDDRDDGYDDEDDEPYERSSIADVREAAKVPIRHIFKRFWPDTKPFRGRMLLSLALVAVGPALGTLNIYLFKILVDDIITPQDFRLFPLVAGAFLAITVVGGLINFGDEYMTAWVGEKFVMGLRQRVFEHMHRLSSGYFETRQLGDLLSRLTGDVSSIEQLMLSGVNMALTYSFQIVFYAGAMFFLNWQLTLAALVAAPIFLLIARSFSKRIQSAARESRRRAGSISAVAEESFGNVALVQAYDRADHESRRFHDQNLGNFRAQMRAIKIEGLFSPISAFVESVGTLVVIGIGVWELSQNRITLGGLLVFLAYISQLYGPVQGFAGLTNSIFAASASAERIIEVLDAEPGVTEPATPVRMRRARGDIRITGVGFGYPGTDRTALHDVDLEITAGTKVAVVGASGAGKSTLTKLLLRTYDPDEGTITLDDVDLRDLRLSDLRRNITAVLQETLVFDGSIADNIRWGRPDATDEDVATAAAAADAHDFVTRLPDGYDTRIGQRGRMLSGGQRQRIAIARAMIRDAPVLLLDEPTTGLDAESTRRVLEPLRRLMDGRTTVIISHNLITVTDADEIVYVEDGTVSARGSHDQLLASSPGYAHLYRLHHPDDAPAERGTPDLEKAPAARPVPRPRPAPQPGVPASPGAPDRQVATSPVPVPFRRAGHAEPPAPRRYLPMPIAGAQSPPAPAAPRRTGDDVREQAPAARPEVYASARSGRRPGPGVEETSLLGAPGPGVAPEWAPGNPVPPRRAGSAGGPGGSDGPRGAGRPRDAGGSRNTDSSRSTDSSRNADGSRGADRSRGADGVDATRVVRPVRPADTGPRRVDGPDDVRRTDRGSDSRERGDRGRERDDLGRGPQDRRAQERSREGDRGREVAGYRTNGSPVDGVPADGSRADGSRVNGSHANGVRPDGPRTNGTRVNGTRVNGSHTDGSRVNGSRGEESARDGRRADDPRTESPRTESPRTDAPHVNGSHVDGSPARRSRVGGEPRDRVSDEALRSDRNRRHRTDDLDERRPRRRREAGPRHDTDAHREPRDGRATGSRDDRYAEDRRTRDAAPADRHDRDEPSFGTGAPRGDAASETTALPRRRPARHDDAEDGARHSRAARQGRERDALPAERDRYRGEREEDRASRDAADRRRPGTDREPRSRRDDRAAHRADTRRHDDAGHDADHPRRDRHDGGRYGTRDEDRGRREDRHRDDRSAPRRRGADPDRREPADVDSPTAALPLVHLTQAFAKLTVPDPRVPDDDVDSETTAFRPIPRPRRRSWLTGELPKVPPMPPRRR